MVMRSALQSLIPVIALMVVGCATAPVYDVPQMQFDAARKLSMPDVERTIRTAAGGLGWRIAQLAPGTLEGTLVWRDHRAIVDIRYDTTSFSSAQVSAL